MTGITRNGLNIGPGRPMFVIAEAGVNHNGKLDFALGLVDIAADAGADAVKFQTFRAEHIILRHAPKAQYHIETTGTDNQQSWFDLLKSQEMSPEMHEACIERCNARGIRFLSTPYDEPSVDLLDRLDVPAFKIASTDANNIPFLEYVAAKGRPIILSTAMCTMEEVEASVAAIRRAGVEEIVVMQCTGSYPAPVPEANLRAMATIAARCNVATGYSDHTPGAACAVAAVALGAVAYERHITLDRRLPGPDHRASLEPEDFKLLVREIRATEAALGDGIKRIMPCEADNRVKLQKRVIAARPIAAGEVIARAALATKRTGGVGLMPAHLAAVVGRKAVRPIAVDEPVTEDLLA